MSKQPRLQLSGARGRMSNYCLALGNAGAQPQPDYAPRPDLSCDGLVLCGGGDADSALFGQENRGSQPADSIRDQAELTLIDAYLQAGKPILGICRGMQMINIALGGTLIQDLPEQQRPFHAGDDQDLIHPIRTGEDSVLGQLYGPLFYVNSYHHQAVDALGGGLRATAWAESGFAEAVEHRTAPVWGVQFHPERMCYRHRRWDTVDGALLFARFLALIS